MAIIPKLLSLHFCVAIALSILLTATCFAESRVIWGDALKGAVYRSTNGGKIELTNALARSADIYTANSCYAYVADAGARTIFKIRTDGAGTPKEYIRSTTSPWELYSVAAANYLYWGIFLSLSRGSLSYEAGEPYINLISSSIYRPHAIEIDLGNGSIYWLETGEVNDIGTFVNPRPRIRKADLNGSNLADVLTDASGVTDIALDLPNGKIYWADNRSNPRIVRANLDGSSASTIINSGLVYTRNIAVGTDGIYLLDLTGTIKQYALNGSLVRTIASNIGLGAGMSLTSDSDGDDSIDCIDTCPSDALKIAAGACGCGNVDTDSDGDGAANCIDACSSDIAKTSPGVCGCGVAETDSDSDGTPNCNDACANDSGKTSAGVCGCGVADTDSDSDGTPNCNDACSNDSSKTSPGLCGCGAQDIDSDTDGALDCNEQCPNDPSKLLPGICGCGAIDIDTDGDATADCNDQCPSDSQKIVPGQCGCGKFEVENEDGDIVCSLSRTIDSEWIPKPASIGTPKGCIVQVDAESFTSFIGKVQYNIWVFKGSSKKPLIKMLSAKNRFNLKLNGAGDYALKYQAILQKNGKSSRKTEFSESQSFAIGKTCRTKTQGDQVSGKGVKQ